MLSRFSMALALAALLGGVAQAHEPRARGAELLATLPADAPPGDCYARVRVPGEPIEAPPVATGARWVMTPGPYGSPGPIWCLVPTGFQAQAPIPTMREGWIRVLCEQDATEDRIRGVQRRLHERGYYDGPMSGDYDAGTRAAVGRFQDEARLDHGGYLSLDTLDALDRGDDDRGGYRGSYSAYGYEASTGWESGGYALGYAAPPVYSPEPGRASPPAPGPCCAPPPVQPRCCATQGYPYGAAPAYANGHGYAGTWTGYYPRPPYRGSAVRDGWLTWSGKTEF